ncbi:unnamed protein product, partial [Musa acuminata var. zebrina]
DSRQEASAPDHHHHSSLPPRPLGDHHHHSSRGNYCMRSWGRVALLRAERPEARRRAAESDDGTGLWKATGCDRPVRSATDPKRLIGLKKTLVYYQGRAPRGTMADRVMNEYRLARELTPTEGVIVLCKICRRATSMKELEQRAAAMEEKTSASQVSGSVAVSSPGWSDQESFQMTCTYVMDVLCDHTQEEEEVGVPAADKRRNAIMHQLLILRLGI